MERTTIIRQFFNESVTPVTPVTLDFLKASRVLRTRIMRPGATRIRLRGTREKFTHYSVTGVTVQNPIHTYRYIQMFSRISHGYRAHTRGTREEVTILSVSSVCVWVWVEDVSKILHAYRVRAVRIKVFCFILHPPPPIYRTEVLHNGS